MSKRTNPTLIGAFVVGAVALIAVGVALLGGSEYFAERLRYVSYFDEQTKGLRVGSNVILNGVRVGYVSDIALLVDQSTFNTLTQVTLEILPEDLVMTDFGEVVRTEARRAPIGHDLMVEEAGLRAQLEIDSFITGQLVVKLGMYPETAAVYRGVDPPFREIPTIPSNVQAFLAKAREWAQRVGEDFDLEAIAERLNSILRGLDELSNSEDLRKLLAGINRLVSDEDAHAMAGNLNDTLNDIRAATADARALIRNTDGRIEDLAGDLRPAIQELAGAMEEAEQTLAAAKEQLRGETVQVYQLQQTLEEVEGAARALREFFDLLERNPEALVSGKKP